jgi:hypothetical protein
MDSQDTQSRPADDRSLGELVASATRDLSQLVHKEVELAKVEIKKDIAAAGKGAGLFGGAGLTGLFALFFLSFALVYGISGLGLDLGWAFLIVGLAYLAAAAFLALSGKKKISQVGPPERTIETVKDDIAVVKSSATGARASARS